MKLGTTSFHRYFLVSQRDKKWGLYATTAGEALVTPHAPFPPNDHPKAYDCEWEKGRILECFAFVYVSTGVGKFESKPNVSVSVEPGHAFLLFPGVWHRYAPDPETGWYSHWIGFDGKIARDWLRHRFISPQSPVRKMTAEDTILATFSRMMQAIRGNRPSLQPTLAGATATLVALFCSAGQVQSSAKTRSLNAIESAIARLQNDYASHLDMRLLAREAGGSYNWFRGAFTAHTGMSPYQYLLQLRLARARHLLAETNLSIKEIAMQTGFEDEHYFSRLFRQKLDNTPGEWRSRQPK